MVVTVEQIREDSGLTLEEPLSPSIVSEALSEVSESGFRASSVGPLKAVFHKVSGGVLLTAQFQAVVEAPCKRCLKDVSLTLPISFTLNLVPAKPAPEDEDEAEQKGRGRDERAGTFELSEADEELFDGRTIDLDPILREQILLALPMHVVCEEGCAGLCPSCGQNLNEKKCGCQPSSADPRWEALKNIKLN
jgi:uncharacterized protein